MPKATDNRVDELAPALSTLFETARAQGTAIAAWRLPHADNWQVAISLQPDYKVGQPVLEHSSFGFLFCPFTANEQHSNLFIKADLQASSEKSAITIAADAPTEAAERFQEELALQQFPGKSKWHLPAGSELATEQPEAAYKNAVKKAVATILAEEMEKVVLSRTLTLPIPANFSPVTAFETMLGLHPRAMVSLVSVPGVGTWIGASPEIMVSVDQNQVFRTVALAGTQPITNATSTANAIWRQKEIEEQALVERYVINCFKKIRLRDYTEIGPKTIIAGNLMHLRTDFKVDMKTEPDFPNLGTDMLHLLHPTSAVCGMPKEPALQFILEHEGYDRSYYSGYLGPVGSPDGTQLYVNLRCMQLLETMAILYAGAGITGESSPEKEWLETQYKLQAMRRVLGGLNFE
ncbi:isochorismate synthase [Pontibacter qinzhouensis]|uniref:Isochorismate synthase n=1 Tax=Pontibacter qinzhouensis TaxID=2603253 RepID=A0A5C8IM51_9BACT|nr:chorismate-binding protein [Pontibacter qinzhouensis]TXK22025.1 isochorismate synthase [Pontibacter qinzhouensis]